MRAAGCNLMIGGPEGGVTLIYSPRFLHTFCLLEQLADTSHCTPLWEHVTGSKIFTAELSIIRAASHSLLQFPRDHLRPAQLMER